MFFCSTQWVALLSYLLPPPPAPLCPQFIQSLLLPLICQLPLRVCSPFPDMAITSQLDQYHSNSTKRLPS
ncbi:hypothetical protein FKM82_015174 [Ascaphus truei]